jgi:hypothetical protein
MNGAGSVGVVVAVAAAGASGFDALSTGSGHSEDRKTDKNRLLHTQFSLDLEKDGAGGDSTLACSAR